MSGFCSGAEAKDALRRYRKIFKLIATVIYRSGLLIDDRLPGADYGGFGEAFYEEMPIRPAYGCKLFWVNVDLFKNAGLDLRIPLVRRDVERWLIETFGVLISDKPDSRNPRFARADRYGSMGGTAHGGSGRCAYVGRFNVKGIGRTDLVPDNIANHRDGNYRLVEAVRSAAYAELVHSDMRAGAVRTLAIIALPPFDVSPEERRCLIVRPNFIRPAHAERSLLFGTAGFANSDQFKDNERVKMVRTFLATENVTWKTMASNAAFVIGSLDANKMAQGRFTSSNTSINGEVADFEGFRIFDNWTYMGNSARDRYPFGKDLEQLELCATYWAWALAKCRVDRRAVRHILQRCHRAGFRSAIERLAAESGGVGRAPNEAMSAWVYEVFSRAKNCLGSEHAWITDTNLSDDEYLDVALENVRSFGFDAQAGLRVAQQFNSWRKSRFELGYHAVNELARSLITLDSSDWMRNFDLINGPTQRSRRMTC